MLLGLWRAAVARRGFSLLHPALFPRGVVANCSAKLTRLLCRPDFVSKGDASHCSLATFLKVMVQSSCSPAKTLGSLNRTKTCMSEGIVDVRTWDCEILPNATVLKGYYRPLLHLLVEDQGLRTAEERMSCAIH